jgi:phage shock protein A
MADQDSADPQSNAPQFNAMTARLLRREALRRAAEELNTTSGPGLEGVLARISAEVTADAIDRVSTARDSARGPGSGSDPRTGTTPNDHRNDGS